MYKSGTPQSDGRKASEGLVSWYFSLKDEYLELCWQYDLPPRDMSLLLMGAKKIGPEDRIRLIRLIIRLSDIEKLLFPGCIEDCLFAEDEAHYNNSGIFSSDLH